MSNSRPQVAENGTLHATDRLMHWTRILSSRPTGYAQTAGGILFPVRGDAKSEVIIQKLLTLHHSKSLESFSSFLNNTETSPLAILLPSLFYLESIHSLIGLLFLEHSRLDIQLGRAKIRTSFLPSFAYPINCIICFCKIDDFNSENYFSLRPDSPTCGQECSHCGQKCRYEWEKRWKTFDAAITAFNRLNNARIAFASESSLKNRAVYWQAMTRHLPVIFKAYEYIATYLEGRWGDHCDYVPRYTLSPHWQAGKFWFPQSGIVTKENLFCLFNEVLVEKQIVLHMHKAGQPCEFDGSSLNNSNEPVLVHELKEYLIDNPEGITTNLLS